MPAQGDVVHQRNPVSNLAVMGHVGTDQQHAMITDSGHQIALAGSRIDRHLFPNRAILSDLNPVLLPVVFPILRRKTDAGEGEYLGALAHARVSADHNVAVNSDAVG
jgi:hypothetical protein